MSEVTLKRCPFCGRETVKVIAYAGTPMDDDPTHWAGCTVCNAGVDAHSKAEAIAAGNTRAEASSAEPVAWMYERGDIVHVFACRKGIINGIPGECWTETPLYAHPPAAPDTVTLDRALVEAKRPIVGIENRTASEVFGIMCDRIAKLTEALK